MIKISNRLKRMNYSQTLKMSENARKLKNKGYDVINLSVGEPDFLPMKSILDYAKKSIDEGHHYYTPVSGYLDLRKAISLKFKRDNNLLYKESQIVVSNGCKQSIMNILLSLLNKNDEVIIPSPYWVSYYEMVKLCGAKPIIINTDYSSNFKIKPEDLNKNITKKTKVFIFSSPCNPTGSIYSSEELESLANVFNKNKNIIIISDEIYEHINYTDKKITSIASFPKIYDQTVTINGLSKSFAMTGWRVGYIGAPQWLARSCEKIQGQITSGINAIAQCAAIKALSINPKKISDKINSLRNKRDLVFDLFSKIKGFRINKPKGAFYFFIDVSNFIGNKNKFNIVFKDSDDLAMFILKKSHVATVGGVAFGNKNYLRVSYATSKNKLKNAFDRLFKLFN